MCEKKFILFKFSKASFMFFFILFAIRWIFYG